MIYCVVAGGWSAKGTEWSRLPGSVIGVNDAGWLSKAHVVVSMDRLWAEYRWFDLNTRAGPTWLRRNAIQNVMPRWPETPAPSWLVVFANDNKRTKFAERDDYAADKILHGTNSGFCALNLAYQLANRDDKVLLVGFDMCRGPKDQTYWHDPYPWTDPRGKTPDSKYAKWSAQFDDAAKAFKKKKVEVINCSKHSAIKNWPHKPIEGFYI